jgi:hypothetical protein
MCKYNPKQGEKTMKKCLMGLLVVALFTAPALAASVYLNPVSQTVSNGGFTTVELVVTGITSPGVDTLNLLLQFDETIIHAAGVSDGAFMNIETFITFGPSLDNVNGEVSYTQWNLGGGGATGSGTAMIFTFMGRAANYGDTSALNYTAWLLEPGSGNQITLDSKSTGDSITVIPEPLTLMLVASGMIALGGYARRKRR